MFRWFWVPNHVLRWKDWCSGFPSPKTKVPSAKSRWFELKCPDWWSEVVLVNLVLRWFWVEVPRWFQFEVSRLVLRWLGCAQVGRAPTQYIPKSSACLPACALPALSGAHCTIVEVLHLKAEQGIMHYSSFFNFCMFTCIKFCFFKLQTVAKISYFFLYFPKLDQGKRAPHRSITHITLQSLKKNLYS